MIEPVLDQWQWVAEGCVTDIKMSIAALHFDGDVPSESMVTGLIWRTVCDCVRDGLNGHESLLPLCKALNVDHLFLADHFLHDQAFVLAILICTSQKSQDLNTANTMALALRVFDAVLVEMGVMRTLASHIDAFRARYIDS